MSFSIEERFRRQVGEAYIEPPATQGMIEAWDTAQQAMEELMEDPEHRNDYPQEVWDQIERNRRVPRK